MHGISKNLSPIRCSTGSLTITVLMLLSASIQGMAQTEAEKNPTDVLRKEHRILHQKSSVPKRLDRRLPVMLKFRGTIVCAK